MLHMIFKRFQSRIQNSNDFYLAEIALLNSVSVITVALITTGPDLACFGP
jgi:hypothetical protein